MMPVEDFLRELFTSDEYREALKSRILAGTCKPAELSIARDLGLKALADENDASKRALMKQNLTKAERHMLATLLRKANGGEPYITGSREIRNSVHNVVGLVFTYSPTLSPVAAEPETETDPDAGLLPPKR
jgi:hypothetical protein